MKSSKIIYFSENFSILHCYLVPRIINWLSYFLLNCQHRTTFWKSLFILSLLWKTAGNKILLPAPVSEEPLSFVCPLFPTVRIRFCFSQEGFLGPSLVIFLVTWSGLSMGECYVLMSSSLLTFFEPSIFSLGSTELWEQCILVVVCANLIH